MKVTKIIAIILIVMLALFIINEKIDSEKNDVRKWALKNNMEIKFINTHITQFGTPFFYVTKGCHIYEVEMTTGEKWWIRTGFFFNDYERDKFQPSN